MENKKIKAFCCSGGGAKGSWGGGVAQYLLENGADYDILVGTSTGSMLIPLIAANEMQKLKTAYTTITQKDIFKVNPFKANATDMEIDFAAVADNIVIRGQKTFGDSSNIITTIKNFFSESDYNTVRKSGKHVIACTSNLTKEQVEYYDILNCNYLDFCDWIQASGTFVPFMSLVEKNGCDYADGGCFVPLPVQKAIDMGATEIDCIILDPKGNSATPANSKNAFQLIARITDCMSSQLMTNDALIGELEAKEKDVTLNVYYTPMVLTNNSLLFDQTIMLEWWEQGYEFAKTTSAEKIIISKK